MIYKLDKNLILESMLGANKTNFQATGKGLGSDDSIISLKNPLSIRDAAHNSSRRKAQEVFGGDITSVAEQDKIDRMAK